MDLGENFSYPITTEYDKRLDDSYERGEGRRGFLSLETRYKNITTILANESVASKILLLFIISY